MAAKNYYDILGVAKTANADEIKKAYRKLAHKYHPDKGQGNDAKFKEVNEAYQVLSDSEKRSQYDTYGQTFEQARANGGYGPGPGTGGFGGQGNPFGDFGFGGFGGQNGVEFDFGEIFSDIFGGQSSRTQRRTRGIDLEMSVTLTFEEAAHGVEKSITLEKKDKCPTCTGSGAEPGTKISTCPVCHGQGQIRTTRRTIFGNMQSSSTCDRCDGEGKIPEKPCKKCEGRGVLRQEKTLKVKIPAGIDNGQKIRVNGEGEVGYRASSPGDLYLSIKVKPSKDFTRSGPNLLKELPISFSQAALGAKVATSTLDGNIEIKIPAGTQSGHVMRIAGKGIPIINSGKKGDLLLTIRVVTPHKLTKKETELLKELGKLQGETIEVDEGFWDTIKKSF